MVTITKGVDVLSQPTVNIPQENLMQEISRLLWEVKSDLHELIHNSQETQK